MVLGIVNESTTAIQILSLSGDNTVYISSSTTPGHFVSIFDETGCATSPIFLNTVGVNPIPIASITVPFGYVSLVSKDVSNWTVVNKAPFMSGESNILALDAININSLTTTAIAFSTSVGIANTIQTNKFSAMEGTANTIGIQEAPNTAIFNASYISGGGTLGSTSSYNLSTINDINCGNLSSISTSVAQSIQFNGSELSTNILTSRNFSTNFFFSDTLQGESLYAGAINVINVDASNINTSTIFCNQLRLGPNYVTAATLGSVFTPFISTQAISSSSIYTSSIKFTELNGPLTSIEMGSTLILNNLGSLHIKDLAINTSQITNIVTSELSTAVLVVRNLYTDESISISGGHTLTANAANIANLTTQTITANSLTAENIFTDIISPSTIIIDTAIILNGPVFYFPKAFINDASGSANAYSTATETIAMETLVANSIQVPLVSTSLIKTTQIDSHTISTPILAMSSLLIESQAILGHPFNYSTLTPNAPWVSTLVSDISGFQPIDTAPFQYGYGAGTYHNPFNVVASSPTNIYFSCNNPSGQPIYCNIRYRHVLPYPGTSQGVFFIGINGDVTPVSITNQDIVFNNTDTSIIEGVLQDLEITDLDLYPFGAINPVTGDYTPYIQFFTDSSDIASNNMTMWISNNKYAADNASTSVMDPTSGIEMNVASIKWPSTLYTTTIQNERNDIQTRSLLYTGSLNNVSDRALKKDIEPANLKRCASLVQEIPLRRYEYIPEFASTFQISDRTRLGILTTELSVPFPKSVREENTPMGKTEVASLGQLKYAHLGATKFLMEEIEALRREISRLK
jgi:hypothetical protein